VNVVVLESDTLWSGAAAWLVDDHDPELPVTAATVSIEIADGTGWRKLDRAPVVTAFGTYAFPKLEKRGDARNVPSRKYRLSVYAPGYTPYYRFDRDGVVIDVYPYDDDRPPAVPPTRPEIIPLYPAADYPFGASAPLIYGTVLDNTGAPAPFVLVECNNDRVLSDARGAFVLPLGRSPAGPIVVDATDRNGNAATPLPVTVPQGLGKHYTINF
jgi:hypothetical protein